MLHLPKLVSGVLVRQRCFQCLQKFSVLTIPSITSNEVVLTLPDSINEKFCLFVGKVHLLENWFYWWIKLFSDCFHNMLRNTVVTHMHPHTVNVTKIFTVCVYCGHITILNDIIGNLNLFPSNRFFNKKWYSRFCFINSSTRFRVSIIFCFSWSM